MVRVPVMITDLTRMYGGRVCLADYRLDEDPPLCVRPLFAHGDVTEQWLFHGDETIVRPTAILEFDLVRDRPSPPHVEDWHISPDVKIRLGAAVPEAFRSLLAETESPAVSEIFGSPVTRDSGWFVSARTGARSPGTIRPRRIMGIPKVVQHESGSRTPRIGFTDASDTEFWLPVNDLAFRSYLAFLERELGNHDEARRQVGRTLRSARSIYLRIGLTRAGWERFPDRHFLQVTGVYTFPDYLDGRCFADFLPESPSVRWRLPLDEVPF